MALSYLYECAPKLFADERLRALDPSAYKTLQGYVTDVLLNGSPVQRASLLEHLETLGDIALPEIRSMGRQAGVGLIVKYTNETCAIMGCEFKGDLGITATMLFDDFGGVTVIEWARFFQYVIQGKYKNEYQSINTRGLNAEFLRDWLEQHYERRDKIISSLRKEMNPEPDQTGSFNAEAFAQIKRMQAEQLALDGEVRNWRSEYERGLITTRMEKIVLPEKTDDGVVFREQVVTMIEDLPKAAYTRLFDFLSVFYAFHGENVKSIIEGQMATWELERVLDFPEMEQQFFYRSRAKALLINLRKFITVMNCRGLLEQGLRNLAQLHPLTGDFMEVVTGKEYGGEKPYVPIAPRLQEVLAVFMDAFREDYADDVKARMAAGSMVLYRDEYLAFRCLHFAVQCPGIEHPFYSLLNYDTAHGKKTIHQPGQ